jgi:hypothetical protein
MNCQECFENLTAFLDGELTSSDLAQMRLHLDTCLSCADELRSFKEAANFIESHPKELEPRLESWNLVRARLSVSDPAPAGFAFFAPNRWRMALASLAIVATLGIGYLQYQQIQKRNLENYITQYMQDREARSQAQSVQWNAESNAQIESLDADNPFIETSATSEENPFSPEEE